MANHCSGQQDRTCCNTDATLPLPVCFSEESIQRQLGYLFAPPYPSRSSRCQLPVHTALVPALLYLPAVYLPISTPCINDGASSQHKRVDSAIAVDDDSESHSKENARCQTAPWFESATAQFLEREKERAQSYPRGRDEWDCVFCGLECFCQSLAS